MNPCFSIQICLFPRFNGGFYVTGPSEHMLAVRIAIGFMDIRFWWQPAHGVDAEFIGMLRGDTPSQGEYFTIPSDAKLHVSYRTEGTPGTPNASDGAEPSAPEATKKES